jgi:hypothetical protein
MNVAISEMSSDGQGLFGAANSLPVAWAVPVP